MQVNIREAFKTVQREKDIAPDVLQESLEAALLAAYKKMPDARENTIARLDLDANEILILARCQVVEQVEDPASEISLEDALAHQPEAEVGQVLEIDITPSPATMGRLAAGAFRQVLQQKTREAERRTLLDQYRNKAGETLVGQVRRIEGRVLIVSFGKVEGVVPPTEQVPGERFRVGDRIKVYLVEVKEGARGTQLVCSRAHAGLVRELFELEIPEILDGSVQIEAISREAGFRTKIAVRAMRPGIDPVGACVGTRGGRIQSIVSELRDEKIDIIRWSSNPTEYIANALSPAKVSSVQVVGEHVARVLVVDGQLSLAIGREGQNVRLAARLTGFKIDIKSESQAKALAAPGHESSSAPSGDAGTSGPASPREAAEPAPVGAAD